jgi:hypothetical protein
MKTDNVAVVVAIILLVLVAACAAPALFLWAVNSMAAAGGSDFYIPHGFATYAYSWVLLMLFAGATKTASK